MGPDAPARPAGADQGAQGTRRDADKKRAGWSHCSPPNGGSIKQLQAPCQRFSEPRRAADRRSMRDSL